MFKNPDMKEDYDFERAPKGPKRTDWDYRRGVPKSSSSERSKDSSSSSSSGYEMTEKDKKKLMQRYAQGKTDIYSDSKSGSGSSSNSSSSSSESKYRIT
jgi:hypothetical protein